MKAIVFNDNDYERLIGWVESKQILQQWASPVFDFPITREQLITANVKRGDQRLIYKGVLDDEVVAHGEIGFIDEVNQSARLCKILINPERRGEGLGTLWIKTLVDIGFVELKLNRIELNVYEHNQSAIACYQKAGLTIEGLIRAAYKIDDNFWSVYRMSILREEWQQQNTIFPVSNRIGGML